jgi:hypothetical protein
MSSSAGHERSMSHGTISGLTESSSEQGPTGNSGVYELPDPEEVFSDTK